MSNNEPSLPLAHCEPFPEDVAQSASEFEVLGDLSPGQSEPLGLEDCFYPCTTIGDAEIFYRLFGNTFKFIAELSNPRKSGSGWAVWRGHYWKLCGRMPEGYVVEVEKFRRRVAQKIQEFDPAGAKAQVKWASKIGMATRIRETINQASRLMECSIEDFDKNLFLLAFPNGVIDFRECDDNGVPKLRRGVPKDMILSSVCPVEYSPTADMRPWQKFISTLFKQEHWNDGGDKWMQMLCGYLISGETNQQCLYWFRDLGQGSTGKGTFQNIFSEAMGDGIVTFDDFGNYQGKGRSVKDNLNDITRKRVCFIDEPEEGKKVDSATFKKISGQSPMRVSGLFSDSVVRKSNCKLVLLSNLPLNVESTDAFWRRPKVVYFLNSFVGSGETVHEMFRNRTEWQKGVILYACIGAAMYYAAGKKFPHWKFISEGTEQVKMEHRPLLRFRFDRFEQGPNDNEEYTFAAQSAWNEYLIWASDNTYEDEKMEERGFYKALHSIFPERDPSTRRYLGWKIKTLTVETAEKPATPKQSKFFSVDQEDEDFDFSKV